MHARKTKQKNIIVVIYTFLIIPQTVSIYTHRGSGGYAGVEVRPFVLWNAAANFGAQAADFNFNGDQAGQVT